MEPIARADLAAFKGGGAGMANAMIEEAGCGALITIEKAEVIHYKSRKR